MSRKERQSGDKCFVIEAAWWRKWCDYVNFTGTDAESDSSSTKSNKMPHNESLIFYEKPGPIRNWPLLSRQDTKRLRANIVEHFDFQIVCPQVWRYLFSWYTCDHKVCRRFIKDDQGTLRLDLYPEGVLISRNPLYLDV